MREWYARDPKNAESCRRRSRDYARRNAKLVKKRRHTYYVKNRAEFAEKERNRRKKDPWKWSMQRKAAAANRRYSGRLTGSDVATVFAKANRTCFHCGKKRLRGRDLTLEHLRPVNDVRYLVVSCLACNVARIPIRGPRKPAEQKRREACERARRWAKANRERCNARWWNMTEEQREARRKYTREYMRKRRAQHRSK